MMRHTQSYSVVLLWMLVATMTASFGINVANALPPSQQNSVPAIQRSSWSSSESNELANSGKQSFVYQL